MTRVALCSILALVVRPMALIAGDVRAGSQEKGRQQLVVGASGVRVRSQPTTAATVVGSLPSGTAAILLAIAADWYFR